MTSVFPLPAPAKINTGPSVVSTASRCCGFSWSRKDKKEVAPEVISQFYRGSSSREPRKRASCLWFIYIDLYTLRSMSSKRRPKPSPAAGAADVSPNMTASVPTSTAQAKERLNQLIKLITDTAQAKGWEATLTARDKNMNRFATISVSRLDGGSFQTVSGFFDVTCHDRIRITYNKTSFHSWGLEDLYDAISNEFWKLPWVKRKDEGDSVKPKAISEVALLERLLRRFHR